MSLPDQQKRLAHLPKAGWWAFREGQPVSDLGGSPEGGDSFVRQRIPKEGCDVERPSVMAGLPRSIKDQVRR